MVLEILLGGGMRCMRVNHFVQKMSIPLSFLENDFS